MSVTHDSSFPAGFSSTDTLGLESEGPTDMEDGEIIDNPHTLEPMYQAEELGHGAQPGGSALSDLSAIPSGASDFPSEDMDTTAHPSESQSHPSLPPTSQGAGPSKVERLEASACSPPPTHTLRARKDWGPKLVEVAVASSFPWAALSYASSTVD